MNIRTILLTSVAAGALAVTVGACTHSGDDGIPQSQLDAETAAKEAAEKKAAEEQAAKEEEQAAKEKAEAEAKAEKERADEAQAKLDAADEEKRRQEAAAAKAAAAKLYDALDPSSAATASTAMVAGKLQVTYDLDGTNGPVPPSDPVPLPMSGAIAPTISGWTGTDHSLTEGGITNHVVSYINPDPPKQQRFEEKHAGIIDDGTGQIPLASFGNFMIAGSDFASGAGDKTHKLPDESEADYISVAGTFDGAAGSFRCSSAGTCVSRVDDATGVSLEGGWYFVANDGAMVSTPDPDYLRFGWWVRDDGTDATVVAFAEEVGPAFKSAGIQALQGQAKYVGGATGKVSVYDPLVARDIAGAFTANATLTAKFGDENAGGTISGMIDGFSVDGESQDWSLTLKETTIANSGDADFGGGSAHTSWVIHDEAAADSGMWEGALYETDPDSKVPQAAAGIFKSAYGNVGRMVGAFGAEVE